jgi:hypothetical protein
MNINCTSGSRNNFTSDNSTCIENVLVSASVAWQSKLQAIVLGLHGEKPLTGIAPADYAENQ